MTLKDRIIKLETQNALFAKNSLLVKDSIQQFASILEKIKKVLERSDADICVSNILTRQLLAERYNSDEINAFVKAAQERVKTDREFERITNGLDFNLLKEISDGEN